VRTSACLDTGVIMAFYSKNPSPEVVRLMTEIKKGEIEGHVLRPILVEVYSHLCKLQGGVSFAEVTIASFLAEHEIKIIPMNKSMTYKAGRLKCQHRSRLSHIDCITIAYALNQNIIFHTTEKDLKKIIPKLKIKEHSF